MEINCPFRREFEAKFDAINRFIDIRFDYNEQALKVAKDALEYRLEGMNEFRGQLNRQAGTLAAKTDVRAEMEKLEIKIMAEIEKLEIKISPLIRECTQTEGSRKWTDYLITVIISACIVLLSRLLFTQSVCP